MSLDHLLSPIKLGRLEIENRVLLSPMNCNLYRPVVMWGGEEIRYFLERVRGKVGLIISPITMATDLLATDHYGRQLMGIYADSLIPMQARMVRAIHDTGGKIFCQLASFGGKYGGRAAPSSIYSPNYIHKPEELTDDEIWKIIEDFGRSARRAQEAGYDGIDIHACHSYLIGQFTSPALNKRTDAWGGSFEKRMKFPMEVYKSIKGAVGEDLPIGVKVSTWEDFPGGIQMEEAARIARRWAEAGIVYINPSSTNTTIERFTPYPSVPSTYIKRNSLIPLTRNVKEAVKGTDTLVVATGSIVRPDEADQFIADGVCDLVAPGRAFLADPYWVRKAREGKPIRPCIRCNVCHHRLFQHAPLVCTVNPYLLREAQEPIQPAMTKKRVMVVGAGPAGISAALAASARGHDVTLYEKEPRIGGMVYAGSRPDCKEDVRPLLDYYEAELRGSDVKVKTGTEVTHELIQEEHPDALVIAVGGKPKLPDIIGINSPNVVTAIDVLQNPDVVKGEKVVVIGGGDVGCETACQLADIGKKLTIVEILPDLMTDQEINNVKMQMFPLLREKKIGWHTATTTEMIHEDGIEVNGAEGRRSIPADTVVVATGLEPRTVLSERLRLEASEVYIVGDCNKLGRIREATYDGDRIGRMI
jgi:2,4-dienoyl-CoA reductase-like NADH-dependent reductase (Old Yellow Enzyme family)/thioredoxin reductase